MRKEQGQGMKTDLTLILNTVRDSNKRNGEIVMI